MQFTRRVAALGALLFPYALLAQAPAVVSVVNKISGEARLSPGVIAQVRYTPFSDSDLGNNGFSVNVGGYPASIIQMTASPDGVAIATAVFPQELTPGSTALTITTRRGTSPAFRIAVSAYAPAFLPPWNDCTDGLQRGIVSGVGLGATNPPSPSYGYPAIGQTYATTAKPTVTVGGVSAEVQGSVAYPPSGEYQIFFTVPPETPEGIQPVLINVGGVAANAVDMLVGMQHSSAVYFSPPGDALPEAIRTAPESILIARSCSIALATGDYAADPKNPPATLGGTRVVLTDSAGIELPAPILAASPREVKYIVPAGAAKGRAQVSIALDNRVVSTSPLDIDTVQPFVWPATGMYLIRIRNGVASSEQIPVIGWFLEGLIDLGPETDQVYLVMSATGLRNRSSLAQVSLQLGFDGTVDLPAVYAGPQPNYPGLDQVNVFLPRFPPGAADGSERLWLRLAVDGKASNLVSMFFTQTDAAK
jgi:uncharacterized protein (TIGR03437 family)